MCVLEGPDLVNEALSAGAEFEAIYIDAGVVDSSVVSALTKRASELGVRVFALENGVIEKIADVQTPQPVLAAVRFSTSPLSELNVEGLTLVLHNLRDPGNLGTIIRSADAAGVTSVVITGHSVDPYNPKTLRATAGSIFHLPIAVGDLYESLDYFGNAGATTWATVIHGGNELRSISFVGPSVVVIGNEADGLESDVITRCQGTLSIAMRGRSESLNAGVAAGLIAFAAMWQEQGTAPAISSPSLEAS